MEAQAEAISADGGTAVHPLVPEVHIELFRDTPGRGQRDTYIVYNTLTLESAVFPDGNKDCIYLQRATISNRRSSSSSSY